jgi:segregation and condensation protein B
MTYGPFSRCRPGALPGPRYGPDRRRPLSERPGNFVAPHLHRQFLISDDSGPSDPQGRDRTLARVEAALLYADEPISPRRLAEVAGLPGVGEAARQIARLRQLYDSGESSFTVADVAGGYLLLTRNAFHPWLLRLQRSGHDLRLTPAALETLAIVAYKQPVMRAEIEAVRGVNCVELLNLLVEKGLVRIAGRHESLGRPQLFGTTKKFLQTFGLNSLDELPDVELLRMPAARKS